MQEPGLSNRVTQALLITGCASVLTIVAVLLVDPSGIELAIWGILPYASLFGCAWKFRDKPSASTAVTIGCLFVAGPPILLMLGLILAGGKTDAQGGLLLIMLPLIQFIGIGIIFLIASILGQRE